jgi:hypothetical protein
MALVIYCFGKETPLLREQLDKILPKVKMLPLLIVEPKERKKMIAIVSFTTGTEVHYL